ncbi:hypothetical protein V6N11_021723 [Hibiscus sabdariffa]|uniref:Uncharacterized protein n=1 Tax=Hibiscus sabdariffa TaxID=183260 RepID=A0ABR2TH29_9ROSI
MHFWSRVPKPTWWYRYQIPLWNLCIGTAIWVPVRFESGIGTDILYSPCDHLGSGLRLGQVEGVTSVGIRARLCDNWEDSGTHCYMLPLENMILVKQLEQIGSLPLLTHIYFVYCVLYDRLSCGMARPRRGVRGGGQAPVHLYEVEMESENEETLPPPPPVGGEANEGGAGPQAGVGP